MNTPPLTLPSLLNDPPGQVIARGFIWEHAVSTNLYTPVNPEVQRVTGSLTPTELHRKYGPCSPVTTDSSTESESFEDDPVHDG